MLQTWVGNLVIATPVSDVTMGLLSVGAQLEMTDSNGIRWIDVCDWIASPSAKGGVITAAKIPLSSEVLQWNLSLTATTTTNSFSPL